jgi:TP901 family phage tail tape measure protein
MPDFAVSTAFTAQDRISQAFRRMDRNADRFGNSARSAFQRASRSGSRFGDIVKGILSAEAIKKGLGLLQRGLSRTTGEFVSFDDAAVSAFSKLNNLSLASEKGQESFLRLKAAARETGATTERTATESAQALDLLARSGLNLEQSISNLPRTVDFSTAAVLDMATATDIGLKSLGAYGLKAKDADQLQKNFTRTTDLLTATVNSSEAQIETLFEAVATGAGTFVSAGQKIETFNAFVGRLAGRAIIGEKAGTALRNVILRLAAPVPEAQKVLKELGITVADQAGNFRDIVDIIGDFETGLKSYGKVQRLAALDTIFGKRSVEAFDKILLIGSKELRSYRTELTKAGGTTRRVADVMRNSLGNRIKILASSAIELGFKFLEAFEGKGRKGLDILTEGVRNFDMQPIVDAVKTAFNAFSSLLDLLREYAPELKAIAAGFIAWNVAAKITIGIMAISRWWGIVRALRAAAGGMALFNAVMLANPVTAVAGAISLLVGGLVLLQQKFGIFDDLSGKFSRLKNSVLNTFGFGGGEGEPTRAPVVAPNREELELRRQEIGFNGRLDITGAPPGSTFTGQTTGAPEIDVNMLGANP